MNENATALYLNVDYHGIIAATKRSYMMRQGVISVCEHLEKLSEYLKARGIQETHWGQVWTKNCREWVYYDCVLDIEKLATKLCLEPCVRGFSNDDPKSGRESGFYCETCKDAIVGIHLDDGMGKIIVS